MNSRDTLATELNVLENFDPVIPESYQDCSYLMLGNLAPAVQQQVINGMKNRPKLIAMDTMNFWMDISMDDLKKTISMVDVLTINDEEARQLSGEYSLITAAEKNSGNGSNIFDYKERRTWGSIISWKRHVLCASIATSKVTDPTGAGDTFAGGFMGYLARTDDTSFENMKKQLFMVLL